MQDLWFLFAGLQHHNPTPAGIPPRHDDLSDNEHLSIREYAEKLLFVRHLRKRLQAKVVKARRITIEYIARTLDVDTAMVYRWRTGEHHPDEKYILGLCSARLLDVTTLRADYSELRACVTCLLREKSPIVKGKTWPTASEHPDPALPAGFLEVLAFMRLRDAAIAGGPPPTDVWQRVRHSTHYGAEAVDTFETLDRFKEAAATEAANWLE